MLADFADEGLRQKVKDAKKGNVAKLFYFLPRCCSHQPALAHSSTQVAGRSKKHELGASDI